MKHSLSQNINFTFQVITYKNDRLVGTKGGVAILVKKGIIVNQEWKNEHFNVITDNEALAIEIELQNGEKVFLATIYCPNGNPIA